MQNPLRCFFCGAVLFSSFLSALGSDGLRPSPRTVFSKLQRTVPSAIIPFNRVGNLIVVQARVDSIEGNFILDTGAPNLVLNATYFRHYPVHLPPGEEQTSIAGRGAAIERTTVRELSFGGLLSHRLEADMVNLGNIESARGIKIIGLLGLSLFEQCELIIDFEKSELHLCRIPKKEASTYRHTLLQNEAGYHSFPLEIINQRLVTTTQIAGKKLKLVIDCAAEANILDSRLPDQILEAVTITRRVKLTGPGDKKVDAVYGSLSRMTMGLRQIENLPVVIINLESTCFSGDLCVNGVLGFDFLSQQKIGFNFAKRKLYIWK